MIAKTHARIRSEVLAEGNSDINRNHVRCTQQKWRDLFMSIKHQLSIAVICGGPSKEADVSRSTAKGIVKALQENYSSVHLIELDHQIDKFLRKINPDVVFPAVHGKWGEDGILQGLLTICGFPFVGC